MFSRIHRQFGTAGLVVSIVALIAALAGGAYAAQTGLNGKQKKEVEKIAKKFAGKKGAKGDTGPKGDPGAPGAAGEKGAKGDQGIQGIQGIQGTAGAAGAAGKSVEVEPFDGETEPGDQPCEGFGGAEVEVDGSGEMTAICNGATGFTKTLPPGETETGAWANVVDALEFSVTPVSFNIPLAAEPVGHVAPDANCPGTVQNPKAAPGHFCLYKTDPSFPAPAFVNPTNSNPTVGKYGVLLELGGPAETISWGTWAVTAAP